MRAILSSMGALELSTGRWVLVFLLAVLLTAAVVTLDLRIAHRTKRFRSGDFFQFWAAGDHHYRGPIVTVRDLARSRVRARSWR